MRQHGPSQSYELESDPSDPLPLPYPVPEAADGGGGDEESDESADGVDLGSVMECVEGFSDSAREPDRMEEESLDCGLG